MPLGRYNRRCWQKLVVYDASCTRSFKSLRLLSFRVDVVGWHLFILTSIPQSIVKPCQTHVNPTILIAGIVASLKRDSTGRSPFRRSRKFRPTGKLQSCSSDLLTAVFKGNKSQVKEKVSCWHIMTYIHTGKYNYLYRSQKNAIMEKNSEKMIWQCLDMLHLLAQAGLQGSLGKFVGQHTWKRTKNPQILSFFVCKILQEFLFVHHCWMIFLASLNKFSLTKTSTKATKTAEPAFFQRFFMVFHPNRMVPTNVTTTPAKWRRGRGWPSDRPKSNTWTIGGVHGPTDRLSIVHCGGCEDWGEKKGSRCKIDTAVAVAAAI